MRIVIELPTFWSATPPVPTHNWTYKDGFEYGYAGALSDDDRKAGKAAADVQMFRYLGEQNGIYRLSDDNGVIATCRNPCQVISIANGATHMAFAPDSIIGAAFTDAFNGQLEVYRDPAEEMQNEGAAAARREAAEAEAAASAAPTGEQPVPMADTPTSSGE